jgi:hypothetical protein
MASSSTMVVRIKPAGSAGEIWNRSEFAVDMRSRMRAAVTQFNQRPFPGRWNWSKKGESLFINDN